MIDAAAYTFDADRDPYRVFATRTEFVDSIVKNAARDWLDSKLTDPFAMAAVGGYGRRELFPFSDIDLLLLVENESGLASAKEPVSEFLRVLWDAGLHVSHSARTMAECCRLNEQNIELHISFLDLRLVCGDHGLFDKIAEKLPGFYARHADTITCAVAEMARARHAKFGNTVFHLEPNIKEAPGGVRDVHLLRWLSQIGPHHAAMHELGAQVTDATDFVFGLRCFLHFRARRDSNLLTFELQDEAAQEFARHPTKPEEWMRLYFRHARRIFQSSLRALEYVEREGRALNRSSLLNEFRSWRGRVSTSDFTVSRERVFLRNPAATLSSIETVLGLFIFVGRHGIQLSWDTQRRIGGEIKNLERLLSEHPARWTSWQELFSQPNTALALREMQETGLLAAAIPEWHSIESLVSRDFYHRYTVDEHTLVAIGHIDRLFAKQSSDAARFHELLLEEDDPSILRLALLLHDLGKGTTPGDHVRGSVDAGTRVMNRWSVPKSKQESVTFLIEQHLDLSSIMNGRDLEDPATARFLARVAGTREDLRRLTLLTYADIGAVHPTSMTPWRLEQLWRVYSLGLEQLTRELASDRITHDAVSSELASFLEGLPARYLRRHTQQELAHYLDMQRNMDAVAVEIGHETGAYLMTVLARDKPGLFAALCGALASFGMNIVRAEAASNAAGYVLDFLRFSDPMRTLELNPSEVDRLRQTVEGAVRGSVQVSELLKRRREIPRPRSGARIAPIVRFDNEASDHATLIDLIGEDRPRLLYDVASALSACGCNIETVMIDTQGHKAIDVFYVTRNGRKLDEAAQDGLRYELMRVAARS